MEIYLKWIAFAVVLNSIGIKNIILVITLKISFPKATIKEVESFLKKTKTKFRYPKSRK